jgi:hypothetical protein
VRVAEKISGALNVGDRQLEKKILSCLTLSRLFECRSVIGVAILDGVVEDGRILRHSGDSSSM